MHTVLGIDSLDALQGHSVAGASWEGFVIWQALEDLGVAQANVIAPVAQAYPLAANVDVLPVTQLSTQMLGG